MTILRTLCITCLITAASTCSQAAPADPTTATTSDESTIPTEVSAELAGHWQARETNTERNARIEAIEVATHDLGRMKRGRARTRLTERTEPVARIKLAFEGRAVIIGSSDRSIELELGSDPVEIAAADGKMRMRAWMDGEALVVEGRGDSARQRITYRGNGDSLSVSVTMTSERLAAPVDYVTTYVRVDS